MSKEIIDQIREIDTQTPVRFHKRSEVASLQEKGLEELERLYLEKSIQLLRHPELHRLIDEGKITLGMIKPSVNEGKNLPANDEEAAEVVLSEIDDVLMSVSLQMTPEEAEHFYESPIKRLRNNGKSEIAKDLIDYMSSGPVTMFLKAGHDVISEWRIQMGPTQENEFSKKENAETIRGRFANETGRNIVHGSDSIESVHREVHLLANFLESRNV